jgi:hypothetical protein
MENPPNKSRLEHRQRQEETAEQQTTKQTEAGREFASVEELLRFDESQVKPPPAIAERLKESLEKEPAQPWWRRIFRRRSTDS